MRAIEDAVLLRAFIGEGDRIHGHALYKVIVEAARKAGLAGATVLQGPVSFGAGRRLHAGFNVDVPGNLPMVIEIVDAEDRIHAFLPTLDGLIQSGLVTLEAVHASRRGHASAAGRG